MENEVDKDKISREGIYRYLNCGTEISLEVYETAGSTNTMLKERAAAGVPEGAVIIAGSQSAGRGRMGRSFFSPEGTGVYMSMLLRPVARKPAEAVKLTTMAAVAACEAVSAVCGKEPGIKWVNDIFIDGKKTMGILTEAAFDASGSRIEYAVLGIGMNAYAPVGGFPAELSEIAGAVFDEKKQDGRNRLAAEFINRFMSIYKSGSASGYTEKYRSLSLAVGKRVNVISGDDVSPAEVLDVDDECRLLVKFGDGTVKKLSSGEISIRF